MRIGFVGLGKMGRPMAANLAKAGFDLVLYDSDEAGLAAFAAEGGYLVADGMAEIGACDAVVTMLPTGADVRHVLIEAGEGAFLKAAGADMLVVDMSSSEPSGTRELAAMLAERGVALVDAPVSGGVARATDGTLAIMAGADDEAALQRARPLLEAMGGKIFETGGSGTGHAVKALNNVVAGATFAALAEAMLAARRFGLDETTLIDVMDVSTGHSFFTQHVARQMVISETYNSGFALGLLLKDIRIATGMADALGVETPVLSAAEDRWAAAREVLEFSEDHTRAVQVWEGEG